MFNNFATAFFFTYKREEIKLATAGGSEPRGSDSNIIHLLCYSRVHIAKVSHVLNQYHNTHALLLFILLYIYIKKTCHGHVFLSHTERKQVLLAHKIIFYTQYFSSSSFCSYNVRSEVIKNYPSSFPFRFLYHLFDFILYPKACCYTLYIFYVCIDAVSHKNHWS